MSQRIYDSFSLVGTSGGRIRAKRSIFTFCPSALFWFSPSMSYCYDERGKPGKQPNERQFGAVGLALVVMVFRGIPFLGLVIILHCSL